MTLEECCLFNLYLYWASRKCRDPGKMARGRVGAGDSISQPHAQTLYHMPLTVAPT